MKAPGPSMERSTWVSAAKLTTASGRPVVGREGQAVETSLPPSSCFPGIGVYKHESALQTRRQLEMCRGGFSIFAYTSLFSSAADDSAGVSEKLRKERREVVREFLTPRRDP